MPWGNRSLLLRDPDGNLVNIFSRPANSLADTEARDFACDLYRQSLCENK